MTSLFNQNKIIFLTYLVPKVVNSSLKSISEMTNGPNIDALREPFGWNLLFLQDCSYDTAELTMDEAEAVKSVH